ncbi:PAS domain-containing sensor histidine kinase [Methanolobus sediminis]|uniref:histidine kinase n=1 Tax=Methanolobus sediminis TaxID=3072978 RepID=A0AA51ULV5_9EURY|nr:PAS domain-containing sensor histidine kinase [Methanolobus sediminis]WMW25971.1 PAS domain-containing sensor histidine kinase [Methanolobus sediminis]
MEDKIGGQDCHDLVKELNGKIANLTARLEFTESKLKDTEEFYSERLNNLNDVLFSVDPEGVFTYINPAIENITGYTIEEVLGTHFTKHVHPDDINGLLEDIEKTVAGEHKPYMFRIVKKDGNISYVHTTSRPIIKDGEFKGINGLMVDIARLKQVEVRLKEERDRAQNYLDIVGVIILAIDTEGNIKLINKKGCEIFEKEESQLISSNWFDIALPEKIREKAKRDYKKFILGEIEFKPYFEVTIQTKDGERIFAWHNRCMNDEDGNMMGVLSSGDDITERKKAEQALVFAKLISENANRTKKQFLSNISHELRTPLNLIIGYSDLLYEDYIGTTTKEQKKYLEVVKKSGNRLLLLLNSMIELSAIEEGKMELDLKEFSIPVIIKDIKNSTLPMAKKKNIDLQFFIDENIKTIKADKNKFKTVLYNLINNAIKFTNEYGNIKVDVTKEGQMLNVSVKDDGIGIKKENIDKLFQPFSQIDSSLSRKFEGAGLGLSIVKEFVEMHGGKVHVDTEINNGSNFSFTIPLSNENTETH